MKEIGIGKTVAHVIYCSQEIMHECFNGNGFGNLPLIRNCQSQRRQLLRMMKLTAILLLLTCLQVTANTYAQEKVTINEKDAPLSKIFKLIENQTHFVFMFESILLQNSKLVTINANSESIQRVLHMCFRDQPQKITFKIIDKNIIVKVKESKANQASSPSETARPIDLMGNVTNSEGQPVPGATVSVLGNVRKSTITDANGDFKLLSVPQNTNILISSIGYKNKTISITDQTYLKITLERKTSILDETVIIAYGTTTKRYSTGNVATVKARDIEKQPVSNPLLTLQGRVPGIFINQNTGIAGGGITVRVQGQNSMTKGNDPLYVIDGIPFPSQLPRTGIDAVLGNSGNLEAAGNPLNYINPSDIESIDILKDADATSIYGSRAANGAILITTKKGKPGKTQIHFDVKSGFGQVAKKLSMLNAREYLNMRYEAFANDKINWREKSVTANDLKVWDTTRSTDWQNEILGNKSHYQNINARISGGTSAIQYSLGATYQKETSVFPISNEYNDERASFLVNINAKSPNEKFKVQLTSTYMIDNNKLPSADLTRYGVMLEPVAPPLYNDEGDINWKLDSSNRTTFDNPLQFVISKYNNKTTNLMANLFVGYKPFKGIEIGSSFGYTSTLTNEFIPYPLSVIRPESRATTQRRASYGQRSITSWIIEPQITYSRNISKGILKIMSGVTFNEQNSIAGNLEGTGHVSDQLLNSINAAANIFPGLSSVAQYKYNAIFGRINYNWIDKYIINMSVRRDGSSRFGSSNQFHNFGSIAGSWIFTNEPFLKHSNKISFGKLWASIGTTGNDQIGDYTFLSLYNVNSSAAVPYQGMQSLIPSGLPNPHLQWEENKKTQTGISLGFLQDILVLSASYAHNQSSNQLLGYQLPSIAGFESISTNFPATIRNTSWEFSLNSTLLRRKKINWTADFNLTIPRNKLVKFPNLDKSAYSNTYIIGQPIDNIRLYTLLSTVDPTTGKFRFIKGDGTETSSPVYRTDAVNNIVTSPKLYGGINNNISFGPVQVSFLFQFVKQYGKIIFFESGGTNPPGVFNNRSNQPKSVLDRWQKPGDETSIPAYTSRVIPALFSLINALGSDAAYEDASYIRLKNASITWNISESILKRLKLSSSRVYLQGQNLLTLTNYKGLDPETRSVNVLPPLRVITAGVQVSF